MDFHPDAAKNFNEKADAILAKAVAPEVLFQDRPGDFPIQVTPQGAIGPDQIVGDTTLKRTDHVGQEIARVLQVGDRWVEIAGDSHVEFRQLALQIQNSGDLRDSVTADSVMDALSDWIRARSSGASEESMLEFVSRELEAQIESCTILIPIHELHLQSQLQLGRVLLRPLLADEISAWVARWSQEHPEQTDSFQQSAHRWRRSMEGRALSEFTITAEPRRAFEIAKGHTDNALAALRMFSVAAFDPRVQSHCTVLGEENLIRSFHFLISSGRLMSASDCIVAPIGSFWKISDDDMRFMSANGLADLHRLLSRERNAFQEKILEAVLLYSRAPLAPRIADKLLYIFIAMETLTLRSDSEPVQTNVAERVAFSVGTDLKERKETVRLVKAVYGARSKFIHHGHEPSDIGQLLQFMDVASVFFRSVVMRQDDFATKEAFVQALEDRKLT